MMSVDGRKFKVQSCGPPSVTSGVDPTRPTPVVLTIAGSDSSGGAGLQADLRTFATFDVHGMSVITALTAQRAGRVLAMEPARSRMIQQQLEAAFADGRVGAAKTGMLATRRTVELVAEWWQGRDRPPLVVDPVLDSTSGTPLLEAGALHVLKTRLLPRAVLITPNSPEASRLTGRPIRTRAAMARVARELHEQLGCAVLLKGGHIAGRICADVFYDADGEVWFESTRWKGASRPGTGCRLSAAIAAGLARGVTLKAAIVPAREYVLQYLRGG